MKMVSVLSVDQRCSKAPFNSPQNFALAFIAPPDLDLEQFADSCSI